MTRVIAVNFSSEGRRGGGSWAQLDEEYEKRKLAKGYPDKILQARRRLINSVTKPKSRNQELDIGDDYLDLSSRLEYAAAHQFGIPGKLPARPYLSFVAGDVERWAKICEEYLIERMSR
jgi:phage gpG-like protein